MNCIGTYDGTIFYNPANKFCIISVKTADQSVPAEARSNRRYKDHLIRFTAVGYEIPRTDAVELELDGEWAKGKYGVQLQVEQWREIVPRTKNGVEGYLASGLIKGIGPKTAADIVERFGVDTLDILEHQPERLLEIRGMLIAECLWYAGVTVFLSVGIGGILGWIFDYVISSFNIFGELSYQFPLMETVVFVLALLVVTGIFSVVAVRYSKRLSLVERIKTMD